MKGGGRGDKRDEQRSFPARGLFEQRAAARGAEGGRPEGPIDTVNGSLPAENRHKREGR